MTLAMVTVAPSRISVPRGTVISSRWDQYGQDPLAEPQWQCVIDFPEDSERARVVRGCQWPRPTQDHVPGFDKQGLNMVEQAQEIHGASNDIGKATGVADIRRER